MSVKEKMTAIANEVRDLTGSSEPIGLNDMATGVREANLIIISETELIDQIQELLKNKVTDNLGKAEGLSF